MANDDYIFLHDINGNPIKPVTDLSAINMTTTNGIHVEQLNGGTIGIQTGYIESAYYTEMVDPAVGPARPGESYIKGGTMYTLLGGYTISQEVPGPNPSPYKVPSEVAVREAIDAYVATGGTGIVPGKAINVTGGSINVIIADVEDLLDEATPADTEAVTPDALLGALSVGQAVDVSCAPYKTGGTITYGEDGFLGGFTCSLVSGNTVGFYDTTDNKFPKYAEDASGNPLHYLFIADVSGTGTITPNGEDAVVLSSTPKRISMEITAKDTGYFSADTNANVVVSNWRQYEVNALTEKARDYLASSVTNPDPDALFRASSTYSIMNKYLVKQDMVCPFIPTISMPDNSDLTVASGLSYKIRYTNDSTHTITADTIPTDGYGWDTHIQMFIAGISAINFQKPLVLMDALTPNAGHNITVKWRNGQALAYVEDTDIGYVVTIDSGDTLGSLYYGLNTSSVGSYIVFKNTLDGNAVQMIPVSGTTFTYSNAQGRELYVIGNGIANTIIDMNAGRFVTQYTSGDIVFSNLTLENGRGLSNSGALAPGAQRASLTISDCLLRDMESTYLGGAVGCGYSLAHLHISGSTITGCTAHQAGGAVSARYCQDVTISNSLFYNCSVDASNNQGGAFWAANGAIVTINGSTFANNSTALTDGNTKGSAIYIGGSTVAISDTLFTDNSTNAPNCLAITGSTSSVDISGCTFATTADNIYIDTGCVLNIRGTKPTILNSRIYGPGKIYYANNSVIESPLVTGSTVGLGVIDNVEVTSVGTNTTIRGVTFQNYESTKAIRVVQSSATAVFEDCTVKDCPGYNKLIVYDNSSMVFVRCKVGKDAYSRSVLITGSNNRTPVITVKNSRVDGKLWYWNNNALNNFPIINLGGISQFGAVVGGEAELEKAYSSVRIEAGASITLTSASVIDAFVSVGSYNETGNWIVGGEATLTLGATTSTISGEGTFASGANGQSDFGTIANVTVSSGSGAGSLYAGIASGAPWLLIDYSLASVSATLTASSTITESSRTFIALNNGRALLGGNISIPAGATISVTVDTESSPDANIRNDSVVITGGTLGFGAGTRNVFGGIITCANGIYTSGVSYIYNQAANSRISGNIYTNTGSKIHIYGATIGGNISQADTSSWDTTSLVHLWCCTVAGNIDVTNLQFERGSISGYHTISVTGGSLSVGSCNTQPGVLVCTNASAFISGSHTGKISAGVGSVIAFSGCSMHGPVIFDGASDATEGQYVRFRSNPTAATGTVQTFDGGVYMKVKAGDTNTFAKVGIVKGAIIALTGSAAPKDENNVSQYVIYAPGGIIITDTDSNADRTAGSGSITIKNKAGITRTVSGTGTYIAWDGSNDFS